jgi:predicted PurR-regulated permease PerM
MATEPTPFAGVTFRRIITLLGVALAIGLAYTLRGVIVPLFLAFLLAYALDPFVDRLEAMRVPRSLGAVIVMVALVGFFALALVYAIPLFVDELRAAAADLPKQLQRLIERVEPWLWMNFKLKVPHTLGEVRKLFTDENPNQKAGMFGTAVEALFGTLGYVGVILSALIVPVFALYLLIDFDRIVWRVEQLVPRRWAAPTADVARQVHKTLSGWVRGQLTACIVLAALYATGLRIIDIRLAVPIGVLTGMLAFVPYIGFGLGLSLALAMSILDWNGVGNVIGVAAVMGFVQIMDGMLITPRIVGRSVGLAPLEVLVSLMAAGSLFGFLGVFLAVPLGAVVKILVSRGVRAYMASNFYKFQGSS